MKFSPRKQTESEVKVEIFGGKANIDQVQAMLCSELEQLYQQVYLTNDPYLYMYYKRDALIVHSNSLHL